MKLAFVCFCIFAVACFHDAVLLSVYDKKEVTYCFWNGEKLTNNTIHPTAASVVAITLAQRCKVTCFSSDLVPVAWICTRCVRFTVCTRCIGLTSWWAQYSRHSSLQADVIALVGIRSGSKAERLNGYDYSEGERGAVSFMQAVTAGIQKQQRSKGLWHFTVSPSAGEAQGYA